MSGVRPSDNINVSHGLETRIVIILRKQSL